MSTGFEAERRLVLVGERTGCLGVEPSPLERNDGRGVEAAMGSVSGWFWRGIAR